MMQATDAQRRLAWTLGFVYLLLLIPPWQFSVPRDGLDPSWVEVISYAATHGWQWGRDIVFTYGPLGFLSHNPYDSERLFVAMGASALLVWVLARGVLGLLDGQTPPAALVLFAAISLPLAMMGRHAFGTFALLAALTYFRNPERRNPPHVVLLSVASAVWALTYVSSTVLSAGILALLDADRVARRQRPIFLAAFVAAFVAFYVAAGQSVRYLPEFARGSLELMSGYAGAMALWGNPVERAGFLVVSAAVFGSVLAAEWPSLKQRDNRRAAALMIGALAVYWFIAFKSGFVRHDLHTQGAWRALALLAAGFAASRWHAPAARSLRWGLIALSLTASVSSALASGQALPRPPLAQYVVDVLVRRPAMSLQAGRELVTDFPSWKRAWRDRQLDALAAIRQAQPLPQIDGTVDVIPPMQSSVIAHSLEYHPRPVFQGYAAYTPWLAELNRKYYEHDDAAGIVLMSPSSIDNRYPLMDESTSIPEILARYEPLELENDLLVLGRRAKPIPTSTKVILENVQARFGEWVSLDQVDAPVMLTVTAASNLQGRARAALYRPPFLVLNVRLGDGTERQFRLIEGIARAGFLLSPLVQDPIDFAATMVGAWPLLKDHRVVAFNVDTIVESGRRFYAPLLAYHATALHRDADAAGARASGVAAILSRQATAHAIASRTPGPGVRAVGTEVYAHAPVELPLPVDSVSRVRVTFGIREGAYTGGNATDGVCFAVLAGPVDGDRRAVMERCLDPLSRNDDRGEHTVELPITMQAAGELIFRTTCRTICDWDWAYWKDIEVGR